MPAKSKPTETPMIDGSEEVPVNLRQVYYELVCLLDKFSNERLDTEYQQLFREMAVNFCQQGTPAARGKRASWAAGIAYAIGQVNFLGDPASEPYVRSEEIAEWFGISTATMHNKARELRKGFKLSQLDTDWMCPSRLNDHPLATFVEINGMLVDVRAAPIEVQQYFYEQGFIPCMPNGEAEPTETDAPVRAVNPMTGEVLMIGGGADGDPSEIYHVTHDRIGAPQTAEASQTGYVLKVTLSDLKPTVWRRLRVADCSLDELHEVLQIAMGWENSHMHLFTVAGEKFLPAGGPNDLFDEPVRSEVEVRLSELHNAGHKQLDYAYDFGDGWLHKVRIEKQVTLEDDDLDFFCLAGERACPPEDSGGPFGYLDLLDALANPQHQRHAEAVEWLGEAFDPEAFDLEQINEQLFID